MKNFISYFIAFLFLIGVASCGDKYKKVETYSKEVNEAVAKGDFDSAYEIIDEMKKIEPKDKLGNKDYSWVEASWDLNASVVKKEIGELIASSNGDSNFPRILFIIEERARGDYGDDGKYGLMDYVQKMALSVNNESLVERAHQYRMDNDSMYRYNQSQKN